MVNDHTIKNIAIIGGAAIFGAILFKALFDRGTKIYRCPVCNLVVRKNTPVCPRCGSHLRWD